MKKFSKIKSAEEVLKREKGELRTFYKHEKYIIGFFCILWALFQLSLASFLILDSIKVRAIHLAFAIILLFLTEPFLRHEQKKKTKLGSIPIIDYIFAILGAVSALYIMLAWEGISMRSGLPTTMDIIMGIVIVVLLLEASRRIIGPALSIIVLLFTTYAFLGPYMPSILSFKGVSLTKYLSQVSLSSEGIYGIPLGVSASIVYLFVLLGALLKEAGAGKFFIDLALCLLGKYKGGPAKAAVVSSGLTGMVSGSSIANIVTTGTFTIPLMKKVGYPAKKAAAIEVAASTDGQLMPPIMGAAAFIIAEYINIPYIEVVKAAAIPAFVSYIATFTITHLEASKLGMKGLSKSDLPNFFKVLKNGFHYLIPIGMLLVELIVLRHTPELSAYRAILVLIFVILYQEIRKATFKQAIKNTIQTIKKGFISGSKSMISVALATAAAGIIVGIVNVGIGGMITQVVEQISGGNILILLLITAIASMLIGMGLPTTATYIVMASLTAPIIVEISGIYGLLVPLMAAHLFCFYFGILADDTPPVGLCAYAAAAIAKSEPIPTGVQSFLYDARTAILPFMFVFNPDLILHNINSWPLALLIFAMAALGIIAFMSVLQGYLITKNKWYEVPFLLAAVLILFYPGFLVEIFNFPAQLKYFYYILGIAIFGLIYFEQKIRIRLSLSK